MNRSSAVRRQHGCAAPWPHRLACATATATLLLLCAGGLVTSTGSGLAVPDWPTTFGYNMFLFPWSRMVGGILYEHSHRLLGSLVGLLTILLALALWRHERRSRVRWLGVAALAAVIVQGVLGGLRVVLVDYSFAIVHACLAQAFFVLVAIVTVLTSAQWRQETGGKTVPDAEKVQRLSLLTTILIYGQLILGAVVRHTGGWVALHLVGAVLVSVHVVVLSGQIRWHHADQPVLKRSANLSLGLLVLQLLLGLGAYLGKFTALGTALSPFVVALATSHVVVGALLLITCAVLTLWAYRCLQQAPQAGQAQLVSERVPV